MANGYIGKISAVVTANTSDLSRKLQGAVKDVDRFAQTLNRAVSASAQQATASLEKIFTPLQRLERKLQAALQLNLRTDDEVRKIQSLVSVAEQINKPLERAAGSFSKLSLEVQGAFLPALNRAQDAAVNLANTLQQQGSVSANSFKQVEGAVDQTTKAIQRLSQAQQLVSQGFTGNELQFGNPRLFETLSANARTTQRAAALPASALVDGDIARQVRALQQYQNAAVEAAARVESLRLEPNVRPDIMLAAERRMERLAEAAERARQRVENAIEIAQNIGAATQLRSTTDASGRSIQERVRDIAAAADATERRRAAEAALRSEQEARLAVANSLLQVDQRESQLMANSGAATILGNRLSEQGRRRVRGLTGNVNLDATDSPGGQAQRDIDALAGRVGQVRQQLETLPNSLRTQFIPALQQAQQQLIALQNAPGATADEIERARQAVDRLAMSAGIAQKAMDFRSKFGGGAGGIGQVFQDQALRGFAAQLEVLQGVLGRVSADARGPAVASFARLRDAIFRAFRSGTIESEAAQSEIRQLTQDAVAASSAVSGIGRGTITRQLNRAGDIGRAGFDRFGLAVQQAAFAIDDFFSVTGGLDQRIRAVGNNITQLGFIIGGTVGLFAALAVTVGTQAGLALAKFVRGGAESEDIAKALNNRLEKQKRLVQDISSGFSDLAGDFADGAFSAAAKQADSLDKKITSLIGKLRELGDAVGSTLDPNLFVLEGRRSTLEKSLENADSVPLAAARAARLRDAERQVQDARRQAAQPRPIGRGELQGVVNASFGPGVDTFSLPQGASDRQIIEILDRRQLELAQSVDSWFATFLSPFEQADSRRLIAAVEDARQRLNAGIADGVRRIAEDAIQTSGRRFEASTGRAAGLLDDARRVGGETDATRSLQAFGESEARRFKALFDQLSNAVEGGRLKEAEAAARGIAALADSAVAREREARAILDAASASARFVEELSRFGQLNETIFDDIQNAAESARRDAVQAAGTAGAGISRRGDAEFAASRSTRLQRELNQAEDRRLEINSQIERERRRFEQESPNPEIRRLVQEASRARSLAESETASDTARAQARQRMLEADQQLSRSFDASPQGQALRARIDDADRQRAVAMQRDSLITRGRELSRDGGQRAARELQDSLLAINAAFDDQAQAIRDRNPFADVADVEAQRKAAIGKAREGAFRQEAPAIFALADAVQNAILQGPSRAALQATDASTVEGARELNRLIRGDDAAKNQDLVQLQREANRLLQLIADGGGANVAN